jgi:hypothetical protein
MAIQRIIMIFKPLGKKVLVAENKRENQTASGIILEGTQGLGVKDWYCGSNRPRGDPSAGGR